MKPIHVCAAVIVRGNSILLATRPVGTHLAGKWEFPGGKLRPRETLSECTVREIREELGVDPVCSSYLTTIDHTYPEKHIQLAFMRCSIAPEADPQPRDGQAIAWFSAEELPGLDLAPADRVFVDWLRNHRQLLGLSELLDR